MSRAGPPPFLEATGEGEAFSVFRSQRHQRCRHRHRGRGAHGRRSPRRPRLPLPRRLPPPHGQSGYKAGNIRDFGRRWGEDFYPLMLTLDADSLMTGETIVRMVRVMQALSEARHSPEPHHRHCRRRAPSRGSSSSACARGCTALHHGLCLVDGRLRAVLGAQCPWSGPGRSSSIATCPSCPRASSWAVPSCRTIRSSCDIL